jgi:site-specific DNA-methyltransferase (adenine-specific)
VPVKIQDEYETLEDAIEKLERATIGKDYDFRIVIQTKETRSSRLFEFQTDVKIIKSLELQAKELAKESKLNETMAFQTSG